MRLTLSHVRRQDDIDPRLLRIIHDLQPTLRRIIHRRTGALTLQFETPEDVLQGAQYELLRRAETFEYRGDDGTRSWVFQVVRGYIAKRRVHWKALKRSSTRVLRLDATRSGRKRSVRSRGLISPATGPFTFAARREQLVHAAQALASLSTRDRQLVQRSVEGVSIQGLAEGLGVSYAAAERARLRAFARLRKAYAGLGTG